jgi:RIO-like serine/threonine protein kinase
MLCLNNYIDDKFLATMDLLVEHKLVVKDRPKHAYYLTQAGYDAACLTR